MKKINLPAIRKTALSAGSSWSIDKGLSFAHSANASLSIILMMCFARVEFPLFIYAVQFFFLFFSCIDTNNNNDNLYYFFHYIIIIHFSNFILLIIIIFLFNFNIYWRVIILFLNSIYRNWYCNFLCFNF